jgi:hypothetical protein
VALSEGDFPKGTFKFSQPWVKDSLRFFNEELLPVVSKRYCEHPQLMKLLANYFILIDRFYQCFAREGKRYDGVPAARRNP